MRRSLKKCKNRAKRRRRLMKSKTKILRKIKKLMKKHDVIIDYFK